MTKKKEASRMRVVLIEDDYSSRLVIETFLRNQGHELNCFGQAPSPEEVPPDAVLLVDVRLKGRRAAGVEFVLSLPDDKVNLPLVFMSNWGRERIEPDLKRLEARRTRNFGWMDKPIDLASLEDELREARTC